MVIPLGPGRFYGKALPRPRFYTDAKLNEERVDPPSSVMDPLLSWAHEAHWSMGGVSFQRLRLQGRIEGNLEKLRSEHERTQKSKRKAQIDEVEILTKSEIGGDDSKRVSPDSAPPAPIAAKRRRYMALFDDEDEMEETETRRGPVRKLKEEFDRVASEEGIAMDKGCDSSVSSRTRSRRSGAEEESGNGESIAEMVKTLKKSKVKVKSLIKGGNKGGDSGSGASDRVRVSPRLAKLRGG